VWLTRRGEEIAGHKNRRQKCGHKHDLAPRIDKQLRKPKSLNKNGNENGDTQEQVQPPTAKLKAAVSAVMTQYSDASMM